LAGKYKQSLLGETEAFLKGKKYTFLLR